MPNMPLLHADLSQRAVVTPHSHTWTASPQAGVRRVMLDRFGDAVARATSLLRHAAGSHVRRHVHRGGEEIFVLAGGCSVDARHDLPPAGWHQRSPPGLPHQPFSDDGALVFVKPCQMTAEVCDEVRIDTDGDARWTHHDGHDRTPLFADGREQVRPGRLQPRQALAPGPVRGAKLLDLDGDSSLDGARCGARSCVRLPASDVPAAVGSPGGATLLPVRAA